MVKQLYIMKTKERIYFLDIKHGEGKASPETFFFLFNIPFFLQHIKFEQNVCISEHKNKN